MSRTVDWNLTAVFLDLDDTLSDELHHMRSAYAASLGQLSKRLTPSQAEETLDRYMEIATDLYRRNAWDELTREQRLELALEQASVAADAQLPAAIVRGYFENYHAGMRLLPGAKRLLKTAERYRTCLISNGQSEQQREKLRRLSIDTSFDHILISEEIGLRKPDPAIFRRALDLTDANPEQAVMIGDNAIADIAGAAALGIRTIWVNLHSWEYPPKTAMPDCQVPNAAAAATLLKTLSA
jgi:putative hydrolase of the HAD superfamily